MSVDSRMVAMSNPLQSAPGSAVPGDDVDDALQQVEHQLSLLWRRARSVSQRLSREVHPDMEPAAYGLLSLGGLALCLALRRRPAAR